MSGASDSGMVRIMGIVIGCLAVIAVLCVLAARLLSSGSDDYDDAMKRNALVQRLEPIAAVRTSADDLPGAGTEVAAVDTPAKSGQELVEGACAACHVAGVAGAPKLDDQVAWAERREAGLDALVSSVINGKGAMPARGGSAYSDEEIKLAVQHIAGFETDEAPAEETDAAAAETEASETAEAPAAEGDTADAEASETAEAPVAEGDTADAEASETEEAPAAEGDTADAEASETEKAPAAETDTADTAGESEPAEPAGSEKAAIEEGGAVDSADALVVGQVPDGMTDNIRATVDGVCAGCHLAGVAGAPAVGDKEAWQLRADKGLAALTSSVINGLNVMPARGGSALSDEEIPVAIQYLMSK